MDKIAVTAVSLFMAELVVMPRGWASAFMTSRARTNTESISVRKVTSSGTVPSTHYCKQLATTDHVLYSTNHIALTYASTVDWIGYFCTFGIFVRSTEYSTSGMVIAGFLQTDIIFQRVFFCGFQGFYLPLCGLQSSCDHISFYAGIVIDLPVKPRKSIPWH